MVGCGFVKPEPNDARKDTPKSFKQLMIKCCQFKKEERPLFPQVHNTFWCIYFLVLKNVISMDLLYSIHVAGHFQGWNFRYLALRRNFAVVIFVFQCWKTTATYKICMCIKYQCVGVSPSLHDNCSALEKCEFCTTWNFPLYVQYIHYKLLLAYTSYVLHVPSYVCRTRYVRTCIISECHFFYFLVT